MNRNSTPNSMRACSVMLQNMYADRFLEITPFEAERSGMVECVLSSNTSLCSRGGGGGGGDQFAASLADLI